MTSTARELQEMRQVVEARGWTRKPTARILAELLLHVGIAVFGASVFLASKPLVVRAAALVVVVGASMGLGTNTHTSSHGATSCRKWMNELLTYFGYPFFLGLSATFWWHQHVTVHHTSPNVIGVDQDADLAPWLARVRDEIDRSSGLRRQYYQRLQWLVLPVLIGFTAFNMAKTGWTYLLGALFDRHRRTRKHWLDLCALLLHFTLLVALPSVIYGARPVLTLYLLRMVLMGYFMFAILAPGHFPAEAICLSREANRSDYVLLQTAATVNFRVGWVGRLLCSGLQYQIEHHLFPGISHVYYPEVSILMRDFCRKHRLPYRSYQWDHVLYKCLATFRHPPATFTTLEEFPNSGVKRPGVVIAATLENSGSN